MTPQKRVTQAEFARICGVNRSTVTRWIQNHRIGVDARGLIDPVEAARMREATESPAAHHQARKAQFDEQRAAAPGVAPGATGATGPAAGQNGPQARFAEPDAGQGLPQAEKLGIALKLETYKLQKAKAETANLELDKLAGVLAERAEFDFVLADFGNTLRGLLAGLPDRLAPAVAALRGDTAAIHHAIEQATHETLLQISDHMTRKTKGLDA